LQPPCPGWPAIALRSRVEPLGPASVPQHLGLVVVPRLRFWLPSSAIAQSIRADSIDRNPPSDGSYPIRKRLKSIQPHGCISVLRQSSEAVEAVGARAVPARRGRKGDGTVEFTPRWLSNRTRCEPGTARAPVPVSRCIQPLTAGWSNLESRALELRPICAGRL